MLLDCVGIHNKGSALYKKAKEAVQYKLYGHETMRKKSGNLSF